jgi:hypothetical protein
MHILRELSISYKGTEYKVVPTMLLLRQIEAGEVTIMEMNQRAAMNKPQASWISHVLFRLLQSAGCKDSEVEVYAAISQASDQEQVDLWIAALSAFVPSEIDAKNPDARAD